MGRVAVLWSAKVRRAGGSIVAAVMSSNRVTRGDGSAGMLRIRVEVVGVAKQRGREVEVVVAPGELDHLLTLVREAIGERDKEGC